MPRCSSGSSGRVGPGPSRDAGPEGPLERYAQEGGLDGSLVMGRTAPSSGLAPRIPSGVSDFDAITGGLPPGSVLLLLGEPGAGHSEFALSSAAQLMRAFDHGRAPRFQMGASRAPLILPRQVSYLSFTRSREQLLSEVADAFPREYYETLSSHLDFADLSEAYFADSVVPSHWTGGHRSLLEDSPPSPDGVLPVLASALEGRSQQSLVIVDSLSDLLVRTSQRPDEILTLVKGLRRTAKNWGGLIYLLLARNVTEPRLEQAFMDSVDAVLGFLWIHSASRSARSRAMIIEKSMPLLSHVPSQFQGRFVLRVNQLDGLVTTQYERI